MTIVTASSSASPRFGAGYRCCPPDGVAVLPRRIFFCAPTALKSLRLLSGRALVQRAVGVFRSHNR
jgi:hypothetical protein